MRPAAATPPASSTLVKIVRRRGVSHGPACATTQARIPVAAATAVVAPAMHCAHMPRRIRRPGRLMRPAVY
jgi:hypothetical protein